MLGWLEGDGTYNDERMNGRTDGLGGSCSYHWMMYLEGESESIHSNVHVLSYKSR